MKTKKLQLTQQQSEFLARFFEKLRQAVKVNPQMTLSSVTFGKNASVPAIEVQSKLRYLLFDLAIDLGMGGENLLTNLDAMVYGAEVDA